MDLMESIEVLIEDFEVELGAAKVTHWKAQPPSIERDFNAYVESFSGKLDQIKDVHQQAVPQPALSQFHAQQIQLLKQQNDLSQSRLDAAVTESQREHDAKKSAAARKARSKRDIILNQIDDLGYKLGEVDNWKDESDLSVSRGLRNLSK